MVFFPKIEYFNLETRKKCISELCTFNSKNWQIVSIQTTLNWCKKNFGSHTFLSRTSFYKYTSTQVSQSMHISIT